MSALSPEFFPDDFETAKMAIGWRDRLVRTLNTSGIFAAPFLAEVLATCRRGSRCKSAACPICKRLWRIRWHYQVGRILRRQPHLLRVSYVPKGGKIADGKLLDFDLRGFVASQRRALERALPKEAIVIGGVDLSYNTMANEDGHWQVHLYLLITIDDDKAVRKAFRAACPPEPTAKRPFKFKVIPPDDFPIVTGYAFKKGFYRRSGYIDANGRQNTEAQELGLKHMVEAALFTARFPLGDRMILKGIRRYDTALTFVLRKLK